MRAKLRDRYYIALAAAAMTAVLLLAMPPGDWTSPPPVAREGLLDLTGWDFAADGIVKLNGQWEFYPNRLYAPQDIGRPGADSATYIEVPSDWNGVPTKNGEAMGKFGSGTYRLTVRLPELLQQPLGIRAPTIRSADAFYVDGRLLAANGVTGLSRDTYKPLINTQFIQLDRYGAEMEIVVQVSNFHHLNGGIILPVSLGFSRDVLFARYLYTGLDSAGAAVFLLLGLFFLALYSFFLRDRSFLIFGFYFLCFCVVTLLAGEQILVQMFGAPLFLLLLKAKAFTEFLMTALMLLFAHDMYRPWKGSRLFAAGAAFYLANCLAIAVLPVHVYFQAMHPVYFSLTVTYLTVFALLLRQEWKGHYGKFGKTELRLYAAAIGCMSVLYADSYMLFYLSWPGMRTIGNYAVVLFVLLIALMLAQKYFQIYTSLQQASHKLKAENQAKNDFLLRTSHELNTPLHGIINLSQAALEAKELAARKHGNRMYSQLELIRNTAYRMSNMVNDIVDLAKMRDGHLQMQVKPVDLLTSVSVVFQVYAYLAKGKRIQLLNHISPSARYVMADESRLIQMLHNLIDNSMKHTDSGTITVSSREKKKRVAIRVEDTGEGIPERQRDVIFQPYEQGGGLRGRDKGGFGIGLGMSREWAELMGGTVELIWSEERKGSVFEVTLPAPPGGSTMEEALSSSLSSSLSPEAAAAAEPGEEQPELPAAEPAYGGTGTVLVVADDRMQIELLAHILEVEGYRIVAAGSAEEAMRRIGAPDKPDMMVMDVMMRGGSGFDACRKVRQLYSIIDLPILFILARNTPADIEAGLDAGGNDFIVKPFDAGEVRARVRTLLVMKRLAKEATANEIAFLQSQIKPHFLYNALGTIMSLCYTDAQRAGDLLAVFSTYLRIIFHLDNQEKTVTLEKELELVGAYVQIEQARFGDRVRVERDVDDRLLSYPIMPLMIQPLVENAIRHGVSRKRTGGVVKLSVRRDGGFVVIAVEDDGPGMSEKQVKNIFSGEPAVHHGGITNVIRRVRHLTEKPLTVESRPDGGTKVIIRLPDRALEEGKR